MRKLLETLRKDEEVLKLRNEWAKKMECPFPPYNYDQYGGIDDYKDKIRERLNKS